MPSCRRPGLAVADTKIDLTVNPIGFLTRALHLWDPNGSFGQLQNQAYGYLWPMGPFFAAGSWLGMPAWVVQRMWWAALMCLAFLGVVKLAERLGIGTPWARLVAGVAFALSPRVLTELGANSVEAWPMAIAPWVLVPLIGLGRGSRMRPAVTRSALVLACAGGVNATAVLAVACLGAIWLATLKPLRRRLTALGAWTLAVVCATAWWVGPLLILGRYSPQFLAYTEGAEVTTRVTDTVTVLRGASHWVAYLETTFGPAWPAGWRLATEPVLVVATIAVAVVGFVGLSRRGIPHRGFLITSLVAGAAMVGLGHVSAVDSSISGLLREFLNGVGSPLRNVHKFDVLLRLPLVLGLAHIVGVLSRSGDLVRGGTRPGRGRAAFAAATVTVAVIGVASPALAGGLAPAGGFKEVPSYWQEASTWLDAHAHDDRVLVVPGASFPQYQWGRTGEEVAQTLLHGPWAVRNAIPLTPPATIRLLDAVESALSSGAGSSGLAEILSRSGVRYVLHRSDLDYGRSAATRPLIVRQALQRSPGLSLVAGFGPIAGGEYQPNSFVDHGMSVPMRALEVYSVDAAVAKVVAFDSDDVTTVVGGPESLLDLAAVGRLGPAPTVLAGDQNGRPAGPVAITDGLRRRDVFFGQIHDNTSSTLSADDTLGAEADSRDYLPTWGPAQVTTARYGGITRISASSSWAQAGNPAGTRPEHQPFAAFDQDAGTSWRPAPGTFAAGQWIEVTLENPQIVPEVRVRFDLDADSVPTKLSVAAGAESARAESFGESMVLRLPGIHATRTIRVTVDALLDVRPGFGGFGITEVEIPGLTATRTLVVPPAPAARTPASVVLTAATATPSCFYVDDEPHCAPGVERTSEDGDRIDRIVTLPASARYVPEVWVTPRPGRDLNDLLDREVAAANGGTRRLR